MSNSAPASAITRNDVVAAVLYPDAADSTDSVQMQFNLQAALTPALSRNPLTLALSRRERGILLQDQNGTIHQYVRDLMSRITSDRTPVVAAGLDSQAMRIDTAYEIRGMISQSTTYADLAGTETMNVVLMTFGQFEQETAETQNNTGISGPTASVAYAYNTGGSSNSIAAVSMTYFDGAVLEYGSARGGFC